MNTKERPAFCLALESGLPLDVSGGAVVADKNGASPVVAHRPPAANRRRGAPHHLAEVPAEVDVVAHPVVEVEVNLLFEDPPLHRNRCRLRRASALEQVFAVAVARVDEAAGGGQFVRVGLRHGGEVVVPRDGFHAELAALVVVEEDPVEGVVLGVDRRGYQQQQHQERCALEEPPRRTHK